MAAPSNRSPVHPFSEAAYHEEDFPALRLARPARMVRRFGRGLFVAVGLSIVAMLVVPWQQSIRGEGAVIAFDPFERPQVVEAPVGGRIADRGAGVQENAFVERGQLLFRIQDQDPQYLMRLEQQLALARSELAVAEQRRQSAEEVRRNNQRIVEATQGELQALQVARDELIEAYDSFVAQAENKVSAKRSELEAAEATLWQAEADYRRKTALFEDRIESQLNQQLSEQKYRNALALVEVARQELENARNGLEGKKNERESKRQEWQAKINKVQSLLEKAYGDVAKAQMEINKTSEEINQKQVKIVDQERKVAVQRTQEVRAPRDGYIMNLAVVDTASIVKSGDQLCRIVPKTTRPAVQVWVAGNDAPLIDEGRPVRLQFEGWPAVQFSGWPSVAVGTFGGTVALVDPTDNGQGQFRVVVVPDEEDQPWPDHPYLRQGVRANGWVLLDQVPLGYELWRRMNGFPPALRSKQATDEKSASVPRLKF